MQSCKKVLVVDDNVDAADLTAAVLGMYGVDVMVAYGGSDALSVARESLPDLIFLDLGMPLVDGYQVAKTLRADPVFQKVKLVALTAWGDDVTRHQTQAAGFDLHLTKPADISVLIELVQQ